MSYSSTCWLFARDRVILESYYINDRPALWYREEHRAVIRQTIKSYVNILQTTEEELAQLGWEAKSFLDSLTRLPMIVVLKRGESGCTLLAGDQRVNIDGYVLEAIDNVGLVRKPRCGW